MLPAALRFNSSPHYLFAHESANWSTIWALSAASNPPLACRLGNSSLLPPAEDCADHWDEVIMFDQPAHALRAPALPKTMRLVPFERHLSAMRRRFILGVLLGILVSSVVAIPVFKYSKMRPHGTSLQEGAGQTTQGDSDAQAASGVRKSTSEMAGASVAPPLPPKPQASKPSNHLPDRPVQPALAPASAPTSAKDDSKPSVPLPVSQRTPLTESASPQPGPTKKSLATLAQLWASFEAGDTKAGVTLADRYLRGDGVSANCAQARVLLFVASKENNADATKKLQELDETGCPAP